MIPLNPYHRAELGPCPTCGALVNDAREHQRRHARDEHRAREEQRRPEEFPAAPPAEGVPRCSR
jgi:hypothetical protein